LPGDLADSASRRPRNNAGSGGGGGGGGAEDDEDGENEVFHFISYVHVHDTLYELDGLKKQPVRLHTCPKEDWIVRVGPAVQDRISRYPEGELLFNLLAIVPQRSPPDPALLDIARRRKVDYEAFTHRALSILGRKSMAQIYLSDD